MPRPVEGYQKITWDSQVVHMYYQKADELFGLMSAGDYNTLKTIANIDNEFIHYCKANCSYYVMKGTHKGMVLGREQSFTRDDAPDQEQWVDVVVTSNNEIVARDLASWEYRKPEVMLGYSPACVILLDGKDIQMTSSAATDFSFSRKYRQTLHMQDSYGRHCLVVTGGTLTGTQCRALAKYYGMTFCSMVDSGGSSQIRVGNSTKESGDGRGLPNVFTFYKKPNQPVPVIEGTRRVVNVKSSFGDGRGYPTRATRTAAYDSKNFMIQIGDVIEFSYGGESKNKNQDVCLQICGGTRSDLIGRWFAYDFDYFK